MIDLHECLVAGKSINAVRFARERELTSRTVKRDIDVLRDRGAPIVWDPRQRSYRYTAPFDFVSGLRLDADETRAIILAGHTFAASGASTLGRTLTRALRKIADFGRSSIALPVADLRAAVYNPAAEDPTTDAEYRHFGLLLDLIIARQKVEIVYQKPSTKRPEQRRVCPLHLAYLDHRWVLVAEDLDRASWRNFLLARIRSVTPTRERFVPPKHDRIRSYLDGSLGRFSGDRLQDVNLRFAAPLACYLREKPWHPSQVMVSRADGTVDVTLRLNNLLDVQRRILACGRHVQVLAPMELRARVAAELRAAAVHYAAENEGRENPDKIETVTPGVTLPTVN